MIIPDTISICPTIFELKYYVDKGKQMEIREILQPDVMQKLQESFTGFGIEMFGNTLYVIQTGTITKRSDFLAMIALVDKLFGTFLPGLRAVA